VENLGFRDETPMAALLDQANNGIFMDDAL